MYKNDRTINHIFNYRKSTEYIKYEVDEAEDEDVKLQYDEIKSIYSIYHNTIGGFMGGGR